MDSSRQVVKRYHEARLKVVAYEQRKSYAAGRMYVKRWVAASPLPTLGRLLRPRLFRVCWRPVG